ncbi:MAG: transposase [Planctomycetota bacterium]|nr:transposase [Planctomycetota bacterium]
MPGQEAPLAYFLTWTTYGTWLHGDVRGSVDDTHNVYGHPCLEAQPSREAVLRERLAETPYWLGDAAREVVARAIRAHAKFRGWRILALEVRTNHVHLVIEAHSHSPNQVMAQCKSWATRTLREQDLLGERKRVWTKMGSTRSLWNTNAVRTAVDYTTRMQ